ncbi:MYND finger domain-containing protein [Ditylenchus destructor]|uniref:MYND finger domain-containing protein n=1 Tax=Ditylenchus destructor TaxID=166010 RepID=A0AAD4MYX6_9BILA|nr:MYND finger domain-containing protein [Ditylenchus destructor]
MEPSLETSCERTRLFDSPFVTILHNTKVNGYCSNCFLPPSDGKKLMACAACTFARYCSKECQRLAWKVHKAECRRLKQVFPNLPMTEVMFLSRCIDKVLFLEENGDKYNWEKERKFTELVSHSEEIRKDEERYAHFEKIYAKMAHFRKEEMIGKEKLFDIFCKVTINSHGIQTISGQDLGLSLCLGVSKYDHSCRPNCSMIFDGGRVYIRPLMSEANPWDTKNCYISYTDVGRSRYRRQKELKSKWYFDCRCDRCCDPADDILTCIKCPNSKCDGALITHETAGPTMIACSKCKAVAEEEYVSRGQETMRNLADKYTVDSDPEELKKILEGAESILHPTNVYISRLKTAMFHLTGTLQNKIPEIQQSIFETYRLCLPNANREHGFELLQKCRSLIENGLRKDALPYAFDAMCIFEVVYGMGHPYYLQTLALWTYLEKEPNKKDEELFALMEFKSDKPIDMSQIITLRESPV